MLLPLIHSEDGKKNDFTLEDVYFNFRLFFTWSVVGVVFFCVNVSMFFLPEFPSTFFSLSLFHIFIRRCFLSVCWFFSRISGSSFLSFTYLNSIYVYKCSTDCILNTHFFSDFDLNAPFSIKHFTISASKRTKICLGILQSYISFIVLLFTFAKPSAQVVCLRFTLKLYVRQSFIAFRSYIIFGFEDRESLQASLWYVWYLIDDCQLNTCNHISYQSFCSTLNNLELLRSVSLTMYTRCVLSLGMNFCSTKWKRKVKIRKTNEKKKWTGSYTTYAGITCSHRVFIHVIDKRKTDFHKWNEIIENVNYACNLLQK